MRPAAALGVLGVLARALAAQSDSLPRIDTTWLVSDVPTRTVQFRMVAGLSGLNGALNFNGFGDGGLTFTVPTGWHVVIHFINHDGILSHSAEVIPDGPVPMTGATTPAFLRAVTLRLQEGLTATEHDDMKFVADSAGSYLVICGVPGHAAAGMWIRFEVETGAERPSLTATPRKR